ncbi:MAG: hypothetical protein AAFQ98_20835, partial [Bacteroidota bacterium]
MPRLFKSLAVASVVLLVLNACFTEPEIPPFNPRISFLDLDGFNIPDIEGLPGDTIEFVVAVEVSEGFESITYSLLV